MTLDGIDRLTSSTVLTTETKHKMIGGVEIASASVQNKFINLLIYGDSGVGKTVLAGSASVVEALAPVLLIDVEGGTLSLEQTYPQVDVARVKSWADMQKVYDDLYLGDHPYKTIILDSLTEIQKASMDGVMTELLTEHPDRDPDVPGQREWGKSINQLRYFVRAYRDMEINTIFTALAQEVQDKRTGMNKTKPSLPGKLANELAAFLDIVAYYYIKRLDGDDERLLLCNATDSIVAKDRSARLPQVIQSPTMASIFTSINEQKERTDEG